ncbi:carbamoyl-phosphate synthase large subunit [Bacteriovorax sp. Seq25_V]|uniref:carbamoyl-phosphate synthase large subunit n=1 Tax=Bacteriovorax sp. Seq25_V TaxID=1201288 RepID=UPI000389ED82|nr:carbamoyl-phosphate synthase large subunit [Bacteriovorax sp. Seq25_V]EQC46320.1 carbamoyl-phosphate synthase, large subunit [Bacteriovorax sp. Seq25_V]
MRESGIPKKFIHDEKTFQDSLKQSPIYIHFIDGTTFQGFINIPNFEDILIAEAAFTTSMSGYQETATDPSFLGQHIIYTSAHIGNYAADERVLQSQKVHAKTLIARNFSYNEFFNQIDTPLISDVDTRALTKYLSTKSKNHKAIITSSEAPPSINDFESDNLICNDLRRVSIATKKIHREGEKPIVIINYGIKQAITNNLLSFGLPVVELPYSATSDDILALSPSLIFLSNGPGDPKLYKDQIQTIAALLKTDIPIRGICLGHQLIGLALGMDTFKLPFGQRGSNHPVFDHITGNLLITAQNHGYAIEESSFSKLRNCNSSGREFVCEYTSLFDRSIEGIRSTDSNIRSVQFHPEANPGPTDAAVFFDEIRDFLINGKKLTFKSEDIQALPTYHQGKLNSEIKKILLVGSGPIKIGQASEFDYSGTQALKAYKELGIEVVLLNSNPATIMTDKNMSFKTYIEPITKDTIKKIIKKENVDAVLSTMGGQTALNICIELEEEEFLSRNGVKLLGANVDTIKKTEDRELFAKELEKLGYKAGKRFSATSKEHAYELAKSEVEFPLIIRRDFALGGKGAALAYNQNDLKEIFDSSDIKFPVTMEKSLLGWKEIELEVMVDKNKNGVVICSIENVDPCGIHTGDSITVAPAQTISDRCYQKLREMSLTIAKHMNVVAGGANVQFAINNEDEDDIVVIEMNPRVSRSSALASKATGYPIAKISAGLAVGLTLFEILNDITKVSPVSFEPTLDYVAVKIPIFPFNKFPSSSQDLGPQMRSVGEVLALGGNFTEALMKALRSTEQGLEIPKLNQLKTTPFIASEEYVMDRLSRPRELSVLTCLEALRFGVTSEDIYQKTKITKWFIEQLEQFVILQRKLENDPTLIQNPGQLLNFKKYGFSDKYLAHLTDQKQEDILDLRFKNSIFPVYKAVDTCSGEFSAGTPYYYSTYSVQNEPTPLSNEFKSTAIFGSGPNRIGQGIEFDYSCVKGCLKLGEHGIKSIMLNSNPETVSTDYDSSDRLYLTPLYSEDLFDILHFERPNHIISSFSGQTGINIRENLEANFRKKYHELKFLGPNLQTLDLVEDRKSFDMVTRETELDHTVSKQARGHKELLNIIAEIGYPVIIRPNYVIGGESMFIINGHNDLAQLDGIFDNDASGSSIVFQVENYIENAIEYDVDLIRDTKGHTVFTVCEHIEHAGVHSGDSGMISPPVIISQENLDKMQRLSITLASRLNIVGPVNFQFALKENRIYCIEANPRGSRTLPFLSKAYDIDLPGLATDALLGKEIPNITRFELDAFIVKQSTFPFDRFVKDNIILGPKMRSTGETLGIDKKLETALMKSYLGNYPNLDRPGKILLSLSNDSKNEILSLLSPLHELGMQFMATKGTYHAIKQLGLSCELVEKFDEHVKGVAMIDAIKDDHLVAVFNTPMNQGKSKNHGEIIRNIAISYGVPCFTRLENIKAVCESMIHGNIKDSSPLALQEITANHFDGNKKYE